MSDFADDISGLSGLYETFLEGREARREHQNFRNNTWRTKDGQKIAIKNMGDTHLFRAYILTGQSDLFKEMVVRLFEHKLKENT